MILNQIKDSFQELESIDLNLLLQIQNKSLSSLSTSLQNREKQLKKIGILLEQIDQENALFSDDHDHLQTMQQAAIQRNQRIMTEVREWHNLSKQELMKFHEKKPRKNPYKGTNKQSSRYHI